MRQLYFNAVDTQLDGLTEMGDPLLKVDEVIDWEMFRESIEKAIRKPDYSKGDWPPYDTVLVFKIVMLISWYVWLSTEFGKFD